jgi:hypothetical protein
MTAVRNRDYERGVIDADTLHSSCLKHGACASAS